MSFFALFAFFAVRSLFFNRPLAIARSRARRTRRKTQRHFFGPSGHKTCLSSRSWRPWRFILYFLTARSLSLTQGREGREGRRKGIFLARRANKNMLFFALFAFFAVRSLFFEPPDRCARSRARRTRRMYFLARRANKNMSFFAFFASLAVQSLFFNRPLAACQSNPQSSKYRILSSRVTKNVTLETITERDSHHSDTKRLGDRPEARAMASRPAWAVSKNSTRSKSLALSRRRLSVDGQCSTS